MQSICFEIRHKLAITPPLHSQKTTEGLDPYPEGGFGGNKRIVGMPPRIAPQPNSISDSKNHFQITDDLHFFHKRGLEEVDEAYDEFESTP